MNLIRDSGPSDCSLGSEVLPPTVLTYLRMKEFYFGTELLAALDDIQSQHLSIESGSDKRDLRASIEQI